MAAKPLNPNLQTLRTASESAGRISTTVNMSFGSDPLTLPANEALDVQGFPFVRVYNTSISAANPSVSLNRVDFLALHEGGSAVTVAASASQLLNVRGVKFLRFDQEVDVQLVV